jgi:alpha-beta hydrolase superfamily lysophospholipase
VSDTATKPSVLSFNEPEGLKARGTLIVIPGRGEQPAVYNRLGQRLAGDAYRVHVVSDPTDDGVLVTQEIEQLIEGSPSPVVLIGSDTGALFAAGIAAEKRVQDIAGLVLAGLPCDDSGDLSGDLNTQSRSRSTTAEPSATAADSWESELDARTTCPTHRGRISDQLVTRGALYHDVPADLLEHASLTQIEQPILGLHGQADPISSLERARAAILGAPRAEFVSISGARHDVLNDQTHRTVAATTVLWLERLRADKDLALIAHAEAAGVNVA